MRSIFAPARGTRIVFPADKAFDLESVKRSALALATPARCVRLAALLTGVTTAWVASMPATASERLVVAVDRPEIVEVEGTASAVVLADPSIAQVRVQSGAGVVVQGSRNGTTNMLVLDEEGDEIGNLLLTVRATDENLAAIRASGTRTLR